MRTNDWMESEKRAAGGPDRIEVSLSIKGTPTLTKYLKKRIVLLGLALATTSFGLPALAYNASGGTVARVVTESLGSTANAFFVYLNVVPSGTTPSCATQTISAYRFAIDPTTPTGQAMIATVLAAKAMGTQIDIGGSGSCGVWGDTETVQYITSW